MHAAAKQARAWLELPIGRCGALYGCRGGGLELLLLLVTVHGAGSLREGWSVILILRLISFLAAVAAAVMTRFFRFGGAGATVLVVR